MHAHKQEPFPPAEGAELGMGVDPSTRQLLDITRFSLPTLLRYEDSSSMGHSVESRLPFLDYRLVEFGLGLATRHKLQNGFGKWIVRKALKGVVPDNIRLARFKRGFDVSLKPFLENDLGKHIRSRLLASKAARAPFLCAPLDVDNSFSDDALLKRPNAFCEATTLLWLADS